MTTRVYVCAITAFLTVASVVYVLTAGQGGRSRPIVQEDPTAKTVLGDKNADPSGPREVLQPTSSAPNNARDNGRADSVAPAAEPNTIPERLRAIFQTNGTASFNERLTAVHSLDMALTGAEIEALYRFLLSYDRDSLVKNDILNLLRAQQNSAPRFVEILSALYEDRQQDPPLRDYAIQHAALSYAGSRAQDKERIVALLWSAAGESNSAIAGTALLGLEQLAQGYAFIDRTKVAETALSISSNQRASALSRITAIQICGQLHYSGAIQAAELLSSSKESVSLRMAAIATLGDTGTSAQNELLRRLTEDSEPRIQRAAHSALERLERQTQRQRGT